MLSLFLLVVLIIVTIGVTFAAFTFAREGQVENTLETSTIMLTYTEGKTGILLSEAYPISDEKGKLLTGENNVFDFTVQATLGKNSVIAYEVTAVKIPINDMTPLEDNEVKLYLERLIDPDTTYQEVMAPTFFLPLDDVSEVGSPIGSMILDQGTFTNEGVTIHHYRLRLWVDENTQIPNGENRKYGVRINVYAKQGKVEIEEEPTPTDESYFVFDKTTKTITNYAVNSDGETILDAPTDVVIPKTIEGVPVERVGDYALNNKNLTSIIVPEGITTIGTAAFATNQLTKVELPHTLTTLSDNVLVENYNLSELTLGQGILEKDQVYIQNVIDQEIKDRGELHVEIKKGTTKIGISALREMGIASVVIPSTVTSIGAFAFYEDRLTDVELPEGLTVISESAFDSNRLTSITIPTNVTSIERFAFQENELISVTISNSVESIAENAFETNKLTSVIIEEGVTTIGSGAFYNNQLTNVTIPHSVTSLGAGAFSSNTSLNEMTIGKGIIEQDTNIISTAVDGSLPKVTIREGTTKIGDHALDELGITTLILPEGLTHIGHDSIARNKLTSITLPSTLQSIDIGAFYSNRLSSITIPANVTTINEGALGDMGTLKKIVNQTGRSFDWNNIIGEGVGSAFVTGTTSNDIVVTDVE